MLDPALDGARVGLAEAFGEEIVKIHAIRPGHAGLDFLGVPEPSPPDEALAEVKAHILEITFQKLRENNPRYLEAEGLD